MPESYKLIGKKNIFSKNNQEPVVSGISNEVFQFFYVFENTFFEKEIEAITVQLLVQSPEEFVCVCVCVCVCVWYGILLQKKKYPKFVTLRSFYKIFKNVEKNSYEF